MHPAHAPAPPDMLTIAEAAKLARCSTSTIRRRISGGQLPAQRHGRKRYVARADVDALAKPAATDAGGPIEALAADLAARAPELSGEQRERLAALLA